MVMGRFQSIAWLTVFSLASLGRGLHAGPPIASLLSDKELTAGWISLFDGQTLYGWRDVQGDGWTVSGGAIEVDASEDASAAGLVRLLRTTTQFADFELSLEFKVEPGANSGVFLRTSPTPGNRTVDCYEVNLTGGEHPWPTGSLVGRKKASLEDVPTPGEWHTMVVAVERGKFRVSINGEAVCEYTDAAPLRLGYIGLQAKAGKAAFRQVKLRPLQMKSLFNGRDLSRWQTYPEMESQFEVTSEGLLSVTGGRGQIETSDHFGDFVLQLECICNGDGLNSGIFFRCIPGDVMMGYESQIQNQYKNGDRGQPVDCGTGGIFRRTDARLVMSEDRAWFYKTIIAEGPHIAVWVNGIQVTDWTDTRRPNPNPRKGLRTDPGTIMIQGHDPTTDLSFRNLRAKELPKRWQETRF